MANNWGTTQGEAQKGGEWYKWKDGDQTLRLVGDFIARYVYWKTTADGKNISIECLRFDRDQEKFTNVEKDWFNHYFPDQNCSWSYVARAIHPDDKSKTILVGMKKGLFREILDVAEELGAPVGVEDGWDIVVKREKTGSAAFNVSYTLKQLKCKKRPLDEEEKATVAKMVPLEDLVPRQTPEEQKELIESMFLNSENTEVDEEAAGSVEDEKFDDIPY